jgi:hypothetical protein
LPRWKELEAPDWVAELLMIKLPKMQLFALRHFLVLKHRPWLADEKRLR